MLASNPIVAMVLQSGLIPRGTRVDVFQQLYWVFLILGTAVGIVVMGYMLYNAYKYREGGEGAAKVGEDAVDRPELGQLPKGSGGGRKLFLSFALSAIIVISLIAWAYGTLLYVEQGAAQEVEGPGADAQEPLTVQVVGYQFGWKFIYPNGKVVDSNAPDGDFRVPADRMIRLEVNSSDVFHNFGIPELRVKTDAIPGQTTTAWFEADATGEYTARCYELCGAGHSNMVATVVVMEPDAFETWYTQTDDESTATATATPTNETATEDGGARP